MWRRRRSDDRRCQAATSLRGRPRGRLRGTTTPATTSWPPQTPHGSRRSSAPARQASRSGQGDAQRLGGLDVGGDSANQRSGSLGPAGQDGESDRSVGGGAQGRRGRVGGSRGRVGCGEHCRGPLRCGRRRGLGMGRASGTGGADGCRESTKAADPGRDPRPRGCVGLGSDRCTSRREPREIGDAGAEGDLERRTTRTAGDDRPVPCSARDRRRGGRVRQRRRQEDRPVPAGGARRSACVLIVVPPPLRPSPAGDGACRCTRRHDGR